jgi:hypothetical protein
METAGTKLSTKQKHELEDIIIEMGDSMRKAYLPYVSDSGRITPKMEWALQRYKWFAQKVCGVQVDK